MTEFARHLIAVNRAHPTLRRPAFLTGTGDPPDIAWFDAQGRSMSTEKWQDPANRFIAYLLRGAAADPPDDDVLVVLNAGAAQAGFVTPGAPGQRFRLLLDTGSTDGRPAALTVQRGQRCRSRPAPCSSPPDLPANPGL